MTNEEEARMFATPELIKSKEERIQSTVDRISELEGLLVSDREMLALYKKAVKEREDRP